MNSSLQRLNAHLAAARPSATYRMMDRVAERRAAGAFGLGPYIRIAYALDDRSLSQACEKIRDFCLTTRP